MNHCFTLLGPFLVGIALLLSPFAFPARAQSPEERIAFEAATRAFEGGFLEKAASDLADFTQRFPNSALLPQATLLEARAHADLDQLDAALGVLTRRLDSFTQLRDHALYLIGEVQMRRGRFTEAAQAFRRVAVEAPSSPLLLKAAFGEALALFRAGQYSDAATLLASANQPFVQAAASQPNDDLVVRGGLLLAEAQLRSGVTADALATLARLTNRPLTPTQAWDREWLVASLFLTNRQPDVALATSSNLFPLATTADSADLLARSYALQGEILRRSGRIAEAFASLTNNLAAVTPAPWPHEALLAISELPLNSPQVEPAILLLNRLATSSANDSTTVAARIAVAELRLQQHFRASPPPPTNALQEARGLLLTVLSNNPPSSLTGRAWLNLGWTELATGDRSNATDAFARAASMLGPSPLQAIALFKLADCQQQAANHGLALTNYLRLIREFGGTPPIRGALLERALYQGTLAALEAGQQAVANDLARRAVLEFPNGEFRDDTRVLYGQTLARLDPPSRARDILRQLGAQLTNSPALPEIQLAVARSFLREGSWSNALHQLDDWTRSYPNHTGIARAEFERAWAAFKAGQEDRAFGLYTNLLARFPDDTAAPRAQVWVGDHLFRQGNFVAAESSYQLVFQRTNWPVSRLTHEARLMAGRAAFFRQGYRDAKPYFVGLIASGPPAMTNSLVPTELVAQAYFALGDCFLLDPEGDNKLSDAMTAFARLIESFPQSREALLARGKLAGCHLQRAALDPAQAATAYTNAAQLYVQVIEAPLADASTRSEAEVGLGVVREKQAARTDAAERTPFLNDALGRYLNVFHARNLRAGETSSPFWVNRAGLEAARLAELTGLRDQAASLYETLANTFPASAPALRHRAAQLRTQ